MALDVLDFSCDHSRDDGMHPLGDSSSSVTQELWLDTKLCRIPVHQCGIGDFVCRAGSGRAARLVAVRSFHFVDCQWFLPSFVRNGAPTAWSEPPGCIALPAPMEHSAPGFGAFFLSLHTTIDNRSCSAVTGDSWFRSRSDRSGIDLVR